MDLGYQVEMFDKWKELLPTVMPFFAVKTNPDPVLLALFAKMNFGFDCASKREVEVITGLGVSPSRIVYSNTRKQPSYLQYASSMGIDLATFDDKDELVKTKQIAPTMKLLLRISVSSFTRTSLELMGRKFGCPSNQTATLLKLAKELGLNVIGVSFHLGAVVQSANAWAAAIKESKRVFEEARGLGFNMTLLDIGGSLPPKTTTKLFTLQFEEVTDVIRKAIDENFDTDDRIRVIAEPGSFFVAPSVALVASIIGKRRHEEDTARDKSLPEIEYFINDGSFSSFRLCDILGWIPLAKPVDEKYANARLHKSCIWGQVLSSDIVLASCELPEMETGDWLYFPDLGGYSAATASTFNGFQARPVYRFITGANKRRLDEIISEGGFAHLEGNNELKD